MTLEAATEALSGGEANHNMEQYAEELQKSKDLKIFEQPMTVQPDGGNVGGKPSPIPGKKGKKPVKKN